MANDEAPKDAWREDLEREFRVQKAVFDEMKTAEGASYVGALQDTDELLGAAASLAKAAFKQEPKPDQVLAIAEILQRQWHWQHAEKRRSTSDDDIDAIIGD